MQNIDEEEVCYYHHHEEDQDHHPLQRLVSLPSSGSLPYDERQAYYKKKSSSSTTTTTTAVRDHLINSSTTPVNTTTTRPRRRSTKQPTNFSSSSPYNVKRRSSSSKQLGGSGAATVAASSPPLLSNRRSPYSSSSVSSTVVESPPPPSLMVIGATMVSILSIYVKHHYAWLKTSCRERRNCLLRSLGVLCLFLLLWAAILVGGFYVDAVRMCTPPSPLVDDNNNDLMQKMIPPRRPPLVEYYIHGRGNGHYARSMAIIETLNAVGVDVRMFIGRAPIWNFFHETKPSSFFDRGRRPSGNNNNNKTGGGVTTAIAVTSIQPSLDVTGTISHVLERIMGDCEVALQTERYPVLVISDGDAPGMLRAFFGGIPSLSISHGQIFNIAKKPDWVLEDARLNEAWDKQGHLNRMSSLFSSWQIGTDFGYLETKQTSAIVARPPLRPEVIQMAYSRKHVRDGNPLMVSDHDIAQRMANLVVYGQEYVDDVQVDNNKKDVHNSANSSESVHRPRKLVLCYFRDHNGEIIIDALLQAGFDVLFFETGYNKKLATDPNRFGAKWIVREEDRIKLRQAAQFESGKDGGSQQQQQQQRLSPIQEEQQDSRHRRAMPVDGQESQQHRRQLQSTVSDKSSSSSSSPRLIRVADRSLFVPFMSIADGIVASAGSQLISECIYANVPLLALYRTDDDEQVLNVELSRQERVMRRRIPIYGASFENFHDAYATRRYSYVRPRGSSSNSNNRSTIRRTAFGTTAVLLPPRVQPSSGTKVARSEFESFVDTVDESIVSDAYFTQLQHTTNETMSDWHVTTNWHNITTHADTDTDDDPFHGMPDAAAIILEIIKQVQKKD